MRLALSPAGNTQGMVPFHDRRRTARRGNLAAWLVGAVVFVLIAWALLTAVSEGVNVLGCTIDRAHGTTTTAGQCAP